MGVCYVNMQNLKFRSWRGTEIDAVKVEASFSKKNGLRQVKKFSFFLLFWLATSEISMKSRWNLAEISRRFHDWPFQIWKFSCLPIRRKMTFSKIDLFTSEKWKCTGVKNANFAIFDVFRFLWQKSKENVRRLRWNLEGR